MEEFVLPAWLAWTLIGLAAVGVMAIGFVIWFRTLEPHRFPRETWRNDENH